MADSASFTSLHDLVQSHLSRVSLQASQSDDSFNQPSVSSQELTECVMKTGTLTPAQLLNPPGRLLVNPIVVASSSSEDSITNILAQQVANMLKKKELNRLKEEEEKRLLQEKMEDLHIQNEQNYQIDLRPAILDPSAPRPKIVKNKDVYDFEELDFTPKFLDNEVKAPLTEKPKLIIDNSEIDVGLECKTDLSYLLKTKVNKGKCSSFGRVLCALYKNRGTPYVYKSYKTDIARFDFSTLSPDELAMKNVKKVERIDLFTQLGLQKSDLLLEREKANGFVNKRAICRY